MDKELETIAASMAGAELARQMAVKRGEYDAAWHYRIERDILGAFLDFARHSS